MKIRKKTVGILLLLLGVFTFSVGCAKQGTNEGAETKKSNQVVTLNFWGGVPPETGPQELVDNWNKANPNIQVTYTRFVNDEAGNTKLETAVMAGNVDIFINYAWENLQKRIESKLLEPVDTFLDKDKFDLEKIFGEHPYVVNGKRYFIPTLGGPTNYIIYNKDMLQQANITIPEKWTWDDYMDISKKLTKGEGTNKIYGSIAPTFGYTWANPAQSLLNGDYYYKEGKNESNFDHPALLKSLQIRYQMENVDKTQVPLIEMKASKMDVVSEYSKGKVAMINSANHLIRDIKNKEKYPHRFITTFAPLPVLDKSQNEVWSGGIREWIGISPQTVQKEAAWKFMKYYATEGYYPMVKSGRIPAWKGSNKNNIIDGFFEDGKDLFDLEAFKQVVLNNPMHRDMKKNRTEAGAKILQILTEESEKALLNEQSVENALKNMKKKADEALKTSK